MKHEMFKKRCSGGVGEELFEILWGCDTMKIS